MKKIVSMLVLGSTLSFSVMQAQIQADGIQNVVKTHKASNINHDDMNVLFDNAENADVMALNNAEMSETKGEGFLAGLLVSLGIGAGAWLGNCLFNGSCTDFDFSFNAGF
ncbi:hypothetical protein [Helicobacter trogontum]|uniref:Bacteriocin n=1 Tax=Helicobacter trogontum TaxID=50960 RepID=A0A4U8SDS7_9HELI|nr:hypothetical protein [Helicobacter trogontum]TLD84310.1 hypothetical protein LS81_002265 [Helicobacter trogontum]